MHLRNKKLNAGFCLRHKCIVCGRTLSLEQKQYWSYLKQDINGSLLSTIVDSRQEIYYTHFNSFKLKKIIVHDILQNDRNYFILKNL